MFEFPFNAEIWGTVSDWAMVIITGATAILLLKTLNSQRKVQIAQQRLTDIEESKYIESIFPNLNIEVFDDRYYLSETQATMDFGIKIKNRGATAKNIHCDLSNISTGINGLDRSFRITLLRKDEEFSRALLQSETECSYIEFEEEGLTEIPQFHFTHIFTLTYYDVDDNKYEQTFSLINHNGSSFFEKKHPISIKN